MIQLIQSRKDDVIAFEVNGNVTKNDIRKLNIPMEIVTKSQGDAHALMKVNHFNGYSFPTFLTELKTGIPAFQEFDKIAVVADPNWLEALVAIEMYFPNVHVRYFGSEEKEQAWHWLENEEESL